MITLILDTSHKYLAVGISENGKLLAYKQEILRQKQSEYLLVFIKDVIKMAEIDKKDIKEIVVTEGPGSYTGMRIAMTFVKVFALTQDVKVFTINTLISISGMNTGFVFIDARSKRTFGAFVDKGNISEERIYQIDEVKAIDTEVYGDLSLIGLENTDENVAQNILELRKFWKEVLNIDTLVPRYLA